MGKTIPDQGKGLHTQKVKVINTCTLVPIQKVWNMYVTLLSANMEPRVSIKPSKVAVLNSFIDQFR